jgi:hypothetical protein
LLNDLALYGRVKKLGVSWDFPSNDHAQSLALFPKKPPSFLTLPTVDFAVVAVLLRSTACLNLRRRYWEGTNTTKWRVLQRGYEFNAATLFTLP